MLEKLFLPVFLEFVKVSRGNRNQFLPWRYLLYDEDDENSLQLTTSSRIQALGCFLQRADLLFIQFAIFDELNRIVEIAVLRKQAQLCVCL